MSGSGLSHTTANPLLGSAAPLLWVCYLQNPGGTGKVCAGERARGEISLHMSKRVDGDGDGDGVSVCVMKGI